jgi:hypothetical protein
MDGLVHWILVALCQDPQRQFTLATSTEIVELPAPKLRPKTVREDWPLKATLRCPELASGASKVIIFCAVPNIRPTVTTADGNKAATLLLPTQATEVLDDHDMVPQTSSDKRPVAVASNDVKLSPITVTDDPPLGAEFSNPYDNTAASNVMPPH